MRQRFFCLLYLLLFLTGLSFGDSFRGRIASIVDLSRLEDYSETILCEPEEFITIIRSEESPFINGFEIEITIPTRLQRYSSNFAYIIYSHVSPQPVLDLQDYSGLRIFEGQFSSQSRFFLQFPLRDYFEEIISPDTFTYTGTLTPSDFPLSFTIIPIIKGTGPQSGETTFEIRIRPVMDELGLLELKISEFNSYEDLSILIDGEEREIGITPFPLGTGMHTLKIIAEGYKETIATFNIERGQITPLEITPLSNQSMVQIECPFPSDLFLDGEKLINQLGQPFALPPGEHEITISWNGFQISRRFSTIAGKNYSISLFMDILFEEH